MNFQAQFLHLTVVVLISNNVYFTHCEDQDYSEDDGDRIVSYNSNRSRIVGGYESAPNAHPSIVSFYYKKSRVCAGTILNEEWIISAAHCISSNKAKNYKFVAGDHNINKKETGEQSVTADSLIIHENYKRSTFENDIVLFKISPKFVFNDYVQPVKMPSEKANPEGFATTAGWGHLKQGGQSSPVLMEVDVPVLTNEKCKKSYKNIFPSSICAGFDAGGKDACQGDSGGPMYQEHDGSDLIIGIVSNGNGCALKNFPGIYTRVSSFIPWIKSKTGAQFNTYDVVESVKTRRFPLEVDDKIAVSRSLADTLCGQYKQYLDENCAPPPVKQPPANKKKGWYTWLACFPGDEVHCKPFAFVDPLRSSPIVKPDF